MAISKNPTKTAKIEQAWMREIKRRWGEFSRAALTQFVSMNDRISNAEVGIDQSQLRVYMAFLDQQINAILLGQNPPINWQNQYQLESYMRAIERTRAELIRQGADIQPTAAELAQGQGLTDFSARPSIGAVSSLAPIHQAGLEFLFTRSYESLKGWTDTMSKEVRQIVFDAVQQGSGIKETAEAIKERIKVSQSRAELIARTETIQAYQQSATAETERAAEEIGEEIGMRWLTALDTRVRHLHAGWHGTVVDPKQNRVRIGQSPFNCRCAQVPVIKGVNDTASKTEMYKKERQALLKAEESKQ